MREKEPERGWDELNLHVQRLPDMQELWIQVLNLLRPLLRALKEDARIQSR